MDFRHRAGILAEGNQSVQRQNTRYSKRNYGRLEIMEDFLLAIAIEIGLCCRGQSEQ